MAHDPGLRPSPASLPRVTALGLIGSDAQRGPEHVVELLRTATRQCRRLVECERARIWITRRGGRRLVARDFPEDGGSPREVRLPRGEGLAGLALTRQASLRIGENDPRPDVRGVTDPYRSAVVIPLFRRGEPFGAIECLDKRGGDFTDEDFDRLEVSAEHVAFALDYALLYQEIERRALEKEVLLDITRALSSPFDLEEVIETIFTSLRQVVDYDAAAIYLVNRKTKLLELVSEHGYPTGSEHAFELQVGQGIVGWVAKTGEAVIVPDVRGDARYVAARAETRSELAAPMVIEGRTIGVFNLESDRDDSYHEGHLELLGAFASQAAVAVERARITGELLERRRLEKELAIAREIQRSFLPGEPPHLEGFDLAGMTESHDEVGGDYYDFIPVSETRLGLAIADSSGKGIPAALLMAGFRMSLLAEIRNEFAIRAIMRKVNVLLHESTERDRFVTAFYALLDWKNGVLTFSNAGHNPPILRRRDGRVEHLHEGGVALGVLPEAQYEDRPIAMRPGDVLVMYTDGVSEAEDENAHQYGTERLERARSSPRTPRRTRGHILRAIRDDVMAFAGDRGPTDDLTLMVLRAKEQAPGD